MMQVDRTRPKPESEKTLKFIPEVYSCHSCGKQIPVVNYLNHLELAHEIILNREICVHGPIYNDVVAWKRTGDNVADHNLLFITDDGRFPGFKQIGGSDNSTDGSKELILSYPNTMYFQHGEDYEEAKFNFAMHLSAKMGFKFVILLGSDEWIVGKIEDLINKLKERMKSLPPFESQAFHVAIDEHQPENKWNRFLTESPKIYYGPGLLRTRFTHWLRYSATQIARTGKDEPLAVFQKRICDVVIHHDDSIRGKERNDLMTKFQDKNVTRERTRIIREAFKNQAKVSFFLSPRKLADWHRSFFLKSEENYSHYIIFDDGVNLQQTTVNQIHRKLYFDLDIDVISAVWKLDKQNNWSISLVPPEANYRTEKMFEIYHNAKFSKKQLMYAATLDLGPVIAIKKSIVEKCPTLTDKKAFLEYCISEGYRVFADSSIQIVNNQCIIHKVRRQKNCLGCFPRK